MTIEELEACIDLHGDDIYSFCSYLTGNPHDRDDLFQDTFLLAMRQRDRIQRTGNVKSYLISLSIGIWKNESRKRRIRQFLTGVVSLEEYDELQVPDPAQGTDTSLIMEEEIGYLRKEITKLPEKYRIPICLFYLENMPQEEIAKVMKIPVGTVKSRLNTARKQLKERMEVAGYDR